MIATTAPHVGDAKIAKHFGNVFKGFFAGIRDIVGGRSPIYEKSLRQAKDAALQEMMDPARALGANAIIAVDLDYETIATGNGSLLMVAASGTAMRYET